MPIETGSAVGSVAQRKKEKQFGEKRREQVEGWGRRGCGMGWDECETKSTLDIADLFVIQGEGMLFSNCFFRLLCCRW